jgi:hypothetical protein
MRTRIVKGSFLDVFRDILKESGYKLHEDKMRYDFGYTNKGFIKVNGKYEYRLSLKEESDHCYYCILKVSLKNNKSPEYATDYIFLDKNQDKRDILKLVDNAEIKCMNDFKIDKLNDL